MVVVRLTRRATQKPLRDWSPYPTRVWADEISDRSRRHGIEHPKEEIASAFKIPPFPVFNRCICRYHSSRTSNSAIVRVMTFREPLVGSWFLHLQLSVVHDFLSLAILVSVVTGSRSLSIGVVKRDGYLEPIHWYKHPLTIAGRQNFAFDSLNDRRSYRKRV